MKKLAIMSAYLSRGGAERVIVYLSKYMQDKGVDTTIITLGRWNSEYQPPNGVKRVSLSDYVSSKNVVVMFWEKIKSLRMYIKNNDIDTVLIMGIPICIIGILGCKGTGAKIVVSERNDPNHFAGKTIVKYISRFLMKFADGYVFQTRDAKEFYSKIVGDAGVVIPNPLLVDNIPTPFNGKREKVIVTAGRLTKQKNQRLLIDAFIEIKDFYPEYKLIIYGEGTLENELKSYVSSKEIADRVLFPGNITDILDVIRNAYMFVLTSDFEGMPNALIEAMAIGLPCISSDCPCGGPKCLIVNEENGLLISTNNKEELVVAMRRLLDNESFAAQLGQSATRIRETLDINNIGGAWYEYLNS